MHNDQPIQIELDINTEGGIHDPDLSKRIIDAILFAAGYPVEYTKLASALGIGLSQVRMLCDEMAEDYYSGRGVRMMLYENTCQLCSREEYGNIVREALGLRRGVNLSPSSLEVLAVVAYHQPVTRAYIEQIRGCDSSYAIGVLVDREMIVSVGQLDVPGRPKLYATTENFLRLFGISSLDELPKAALSPDKGESGDTGSSSEAGEQSVSYTADSEEESSAAADKTGQEG